MKYWSRTDGLGTCRGGPTPPWGCTNTFSLHGRRWRFASWRFNHRHGEAARQTLTFTAVGARQVTFTTQPTN